MLCFKTMLHNSIILCHLVVSYNSTISHTILYSSSWNLMSYLNIIHIQLSVQNIPIHVINNDKSHIRIMVPPPLPVLSKFFMELRVEIQNATIDDLLAERLKEKIVTGCFGQASSGKKTRKVFCRIHFTHIDTNTNRVFVISVLGQIKQNSTDLVTINFTAPLQVNLRNSHVLYKSNNW